MEEAGLWGGGGGGIIQLTGGGGSMPIKLVPSIPAPLPLPATRPGVLAGQTWAEGTALLGCSLMGVPATAPVMAASVLALRISMWLLPPLLPPLPMAVAAEGDSGGARLRL